MRLISNKQTTFCFNHTKTSGRKQWKKIAEILNANPDISVMVWNDLNTKKDGSPKKNTGAKGMTADQILRFAIVKMREELTYRALHDRVDDSICLRDFCDVTYTSVPAFTTLNDNIKKLRPETLKRVNDAIVIYAEKLGVEDGKEIRIDTTAMESNIHHPIDSALLWDCIRVITRVLRNIETNFSRLHRCFSDHTRSAKKLLFKLYNARGIKQRKKLYRKLLKIARRVVDYAYQAIEALDVNNCVGCEDIFQAIAFQQELTHFTTLAEKVIEQTKRRIINGEKVEAKDKIVSIFEEHADIIVKGQREITYGHKVLFVGGRSNLILDCRVEQGNPADANQFIPALERQNKLFDKVPEKVATDSGFASKANGKAAIALGVKDVAFSTRKGNKLSELVQSVRTYKRLRKWRSGIEAIISTAKRAFGLDRCDWSGFDSFQSYVQLGVLAFNLQTLARHLL